MLKEPWSDSLIKHLKSIIGFLDTLKVPRRVDPSDNTSIGKLWLERNGIKETLKKLGAKTGRLEEELQSTRDELQYKRLLLEELSSNFEVQAESASISLASKSSGGG